MKLFVIVLHFGSPKVTQKCLESVVENLKIDQVLVVDNDFKSRFDIQHSRIKYKKLRIIKNEKNLGFAGGMNVGIKYAITKGAGYVLLLNNDTLVEEDFLTRLIQLFSKQKNTGIVGPAIKFERKGKTIYDLGGRVDMMFGKTKHIEVDKEMLKSIQYDKVLEADYVSGCCMLIKRAVFNKVGFFDEDFFLYYEDVDFCLRAKKAGFLTAVQPTVSIYHELSNSVGKESDLASYHQARSALIFAKKHLGWNRVFNFFFVLLQSFILGKSSFSAIFNYLKGRK